MVRYVHTATNKHLFTDESNGTLHGHQQDKRMFTNEPKELSRPHKKRRLRRGDKYAQEGYGSMCDLLAGCLTFGNNTTVGQGPFW